MTALPDPVPDLVDGEFEGLLAHAAVQERLTDYEGRLQADEVDLTPQAEVRRRIAGRKEELLDHILATDPLYVGSMSLAEAEVANGQRG